MTDDEYTWKCIKKGFGLPPLGKDGKIIRVFDVSEDNSPVNNPSCCNYCGEENALGKTPFCPYCGKKDAYKNAKCPYYQEREATRTLSDFERGYLLAKTGEQRYEITEAKGECWGAGPEIEPCPCEGNIKECPRIRQEMEKNNRVAKKQRKGDK